MSNSAKHSDESGTNYSKLDRILTLIALLLIAAVIIYSIISERLDSGSRIIYLPESSSGTFVSSEQPDSGLNLANADDSEPAASDDSSLPPDTDTQSLTENNETKSPININTATSEELKTLPGIGDVKAAAIIKYRETYGDFASLNELCEVNGIGVKTLEKIRDMITLG